MNARIDPYVADALRYITRALEEVQAGLPHPASEHVSYHLADLRAAMMHVNEKSPE